jgi:chain length determinant protein tyrosine kinase EpsG
MVEAGMLQEPAVERILAWARQEGLRFGEAAVRSRLATDEQVRRALAFQFDHAILDPTSSGASPELVAAFDAPAQVVADLRRLRTHVDAWSGRGLSGAGGPRRGRVLAVAGAGRGEGRTFVAANLAVSFSQIGRRTLLVDGDLSGGRIHELFGVDNRTGLSAMLAGRTAPGAIRRVPGLPDLSIVTSGAAAPNATDLLSRPALETLLDAFRSRHELIVVDAPPAAAGADAELLARQADGVLLVARAGRSGFDAVRRFAGDLRAAGVSTLGPVLVRG